MALQAADSDIEAQEKSLSELIRDLKDPDPEVRMAAAGQMSTMEPWDAERGSVREGITGISLDGFQESR